MMRVQFEGAPLGSVTLVRSLVVVELDQGGKRGLELVPPPEVASMEYDSSVLMKDSPLQSLHERARPCISRPRSLRNAIPVSSPRSSGLS